MTNEQMRNWRQCHPGCECPDCGTMIAAAYGLARDVCERAAADAGIKADLDEVLGRTIRGPDAGMAVTQQPRQVRVYRLFGHEWCAARPRGRG